MRPTEGASKSGTQSRHRTEPRVVRIPFVGNRSLMLAGTPASGAAASPASHAASARRAWSSASSGVTVTKAFTSGSSRSIRSSAARVTSTGESSLAR